MKRQILLVAVIATVLAGGSIQLSATMSADDDIRSADQQWLKVFAARDLEKSVAFIAPGGSVLAPNAPIATGPDDIRKLFSGLFALPGLKIKWTIAESAAARSGDIGYTRGTYEMSYKGPDGQPVTDRGKYVTVWRKLSDGTWKVANDIFNSDLPLPAAK